MPDAPALHLNEIAVGLVGWGPRLEQNMERIQAHLSEQPLAIPRVYRTSGSNPDLSKFLNLVDFPAASYQGCLVWIQDPGGSNWSGVMIDTVDASTGNAHTNQYAFSNGTNWIWLFRPTTIVDGIS